MNDTTTAVICIDRLSSVLAWAAVRRIESPYRSDEGVPRVISRGPTFETLLSDAFDQIRRNAGGNTAALLRLFDSLATLTAVTRAPARRRLLARHVRLVGEAVERTVHTSPERSLLECRRDELLRLLE